MQSSAVPSKISQWEGIICGRSKYVKISQDTSSGIILVITLTLIGWGKMSLRFVEATISTIPVYEEEPYEAAGIERVD